MTNKWLKIAKKDLKGLKWLINDCKFVQRRNRTVHGRFCWKVICNILFETRFFDTLGKYRAVFPFEQTNKINLILLCNDQKGKNRFVFFYSSQLYIQFIFWKRNFSVLYSLPWLLSASVRRKEHLARENEFIPQTKSTTKIQM